MKKFFLLIVIILIIGISFFAYNNNKVEIKEEKIESKDKVEEIEEKEILKNGLLIGEYKDLKRGEKITIKGEEGDNYIVILEKEEILIPKDLIISFEFNDKEDYSLMIDVSEFNITSEKEDVKFNDGIDFAEFIIKNKINYAYLRIGGRGYGKEGKMYNDDKVDIYIDVCEYLEIPYGFYFIEEALNEEEIIEEIEFINNILAGKNLKYNKLPLAIDLENQHGIGRTDNTWNNRTELINKFVEEFKKQEKEVILYANGARIETYIKDANIKFWAAMYRKDDKLPQKWYKEMILEEMKAIEDNKVSLENSVLSIKINLSDTNTIKYSEEYLDKVIAWQFTEDGAKDDNINKHIDLSIVNNNHFKKYLEK